ncbi:isoflavone reductase family protein [Ceratocystis lukuohia]|uniref:Isoflavone reductase family protein n=1 Tax=Ceratocystis lukuohia TaxID=2019550 RepID=A0ABR4MQU5_9PEZI
MTSPITVAVIGATGKTGRSVVQGLIESQTHFNVISLTRTGSIESPANQGLATQGVRIIGYDLDGPRQKLVDALRGVDALISCITWEHLHHQLPWIEAAKEAGIKRFVPSEWVGPATKGVIDIKDKKLDILSAIQRAHLPYTIIDVGCYYQVFVPKIPSGRSDHAHSKYIDHRIVAGGNQKFALTDLKDIGRYVARIIEDPRTVNKHVFAYTEVLSMNEIWDAMKTSSGETPLKEDVSEAEIKEIIEACRNKLSCSSESAHHPDNIMDTANFNMGQYRLSWCVRGDNTPEYADYLGYLNFWHLFPGSPKGKSLEAFFKDIVKETPTGSQE